MLKQDPPSARTCELTPRERVEVRLLREPAEHDTAPFESRRPQPHPRGLGEAPQDILSSQGGIARVRVEVILYRSAFARPEKGCTGEAGVSGFMLFSRRRVVPFLAANLDIGERGDKACAEIFLGDQGRFTSRLLA